jgi:hypothetical protein
MPDQSQAAQEGRVSKHTRSISFATGGFLFVAGLIAFFRTPYAIAESADYNRLMD